MPPTSMIAGSGNSVDGHWSRTRQATCRPGTDATPDVSSWQRGGEMLIVDVANVMGSRPDGWWRDRAAAAARLHCAVLEAIGAGALVNDVVLVVEGAALPGVPAGRDERQPTVEVVHAKGSGDDAVVDRVEQARAHLPEPDGGTETAGPVPPVALVTPVTVVTADRVLRERVHSAGGATIGPRWLLERLG